MTYLRSILFGIMLVFIAVGVSAEAAPTSPTAIYTVDNSSDDPTLKTCSLSMLNDCSLRGAIIKANDSGGNHSIFFDGDRDIVLNTATPVVTRDNLSIIAFPSQDVTLTRLAGSSIFEIESDGVTISGLKMKAQPTGDGSAIIQLNGTATGAKIYDNLIGTFDSVATSCSGIYHGASGIWVKSSGEEPDTRAWIYGNTISCMLNEGIYVSGFTAFDTGAVVIGVNSADSATSAESNIIRENRTGIRLLNVLPSTTIRNNIIEGNATGIQIIGGRSHKLFGNDISNFSIVGIRLDTDTSGNQIGCAEGGPFSAEYRNIIHNARGDAIQIDGVGTRFNTVYCNYIGVDATGTASSPNEGVGIRLTNSASQNKIGKDANTRNIITTNGEGGISINNSYKNNVSGNLIGTDISGRNVLSSSTSQSIGIMVSNRDSIDNLIGGSTQDSANVIAGQSSVGILFSGAGAGNLIGRNLVGYALGSPKLVLGNDGYGIEIKNSSDVNIGVGTGCSGVEPCLEIAGNRTGIFLKGSQSVTIGEGAFIYENSSDGVEILEVTDSVIEPKWVIDNGGTGVLVREYSCSDCRRTTGGVQIRPKLVVNNGGLAIDLAPIWDADGYTPNDVGDGDTGPNALLNHPVETSTSGSTVNGIACGSCEIHIVDTSAASAGPTENGGGGNWVGLVTANSVGLWTVDLSTFSVSPADAAFVAIDASGNTSELSPRGGVPTAIALTQQSAVVPQQVTIVAILSFALLVMTLSMMHFAGVERRIS